jgi:plasmid stabilization system protein ParE
LSYRVLITEQALARIDEQAAHIAVDAGAPLNAARWLSRVLAAAETLESMPRRCPRAPEDGHRPFEIRALSVDGFLLLFTIDEGERTVTVLNARHARQLPRPDELPPRQ